jgi:quinoprotein glucose dehydrogenase
VNPYLLTPAERAKWKDILASARNEGLFTPPSTRDTVALPGARGSSNWGTTASVPSRGIVYVLSQDWPSIYRLSKDPPGRNRPAVPGGPGQQGRSLYAQRCQACHGANFAGSPAVVSLAGLHAKMEFDDFGHVVLTGRGKMPAFPQIDAGALRALYDYIGNPGGRPGAAPGRTAEARPAPPGGPVVASGGAPGGDIARPGVGGFGPAGGAPYPADAEAPSDRYYSGYGFQARIISPPWSSLVAYDLNTGTIKWKVPLGEDPEAVAAGVRNTGVFGMKSGAVVTATGLLFIALRDGKVRAYDEETGKVLWTADLPAGSEGIPAMYEVNGRQYLVVSACSDINPSKPSPPGQPAGPESPNPTRGYVVFALPVSVNPTD